MGHLDELLARIDSMKRTVGRNVSDMATDPSLYAEKIVGALRNRNAGVAPVIAGGELANRPLTMDERVSDAIDNLAGAGITKAFKARPLTVFELRHATAQRNAALPVEQGGLGLGPQNTAQERAAAMGFDTHFQHGTDDAGITAFDLAKTQKSDPGYLGQAVYGGPLGGTAYTGGGVVYPLVARSEGMQRITPQNWNVDSPYAEVADAFAKNLGNKKKVAQGFTKKKLESGIAGIIDESGGTGLEQIAVYDPSRIRSRFAAFDPMRRHEADIMGFADPYLLAGIGSGGLLASLAVNKLRNRNE